VAVVLLLAVKVLVQICLSCSLENVCKQVSNTVELQLTGLMGTARHPDIQKFRIIGFFSENRLHWQFELGGKKFCKLLF